MAGKSLGTLTIDLIANVGGFVRGMGQAERASAQWRRNVEQNVRAASRGLAAAGAAAAGLAAAGVALVRSTAEQTAETDRWAKSLGTSTQNLLAMQYAAKQAGFESDQLSDLLKDINDNVGDAVNNGGNFADALNQIGLSAKSLIQLRPDQMLDRIASAIVNSGASLAQQTNWAETFGNDLSRLLPLYRNNSEQLNRLKQQAIDFHVAPSQQEIDKLVQVNQFFNQIEGSLSGLKNQIAISLLNIDLSPMTTAFEHLRDDLTDPKMLDGLVKLASEIASVADGLVRAGSAAGDIINRLNTHRAGRTGDVDLTNPAQINARLNELYKQAGLNDFENAARGLALGINTPEPADRNNEILRLTFALDRLARQQQQQNNTPDRAGQITNNLLDSLTSRLAPGTQNADPSKIASSQATLQNAIKSTTQSYANQLQVIDATGHQLGDLNELQRLNQRIASGDLQGATQAQQEKLRGLASEVDRRRELNSELQKQQQLQQFLQNLNDANNNTRDQLQTSTRFAGFGDQFRQQQNDLIQARQQFGDQIRELLNQSAATDNSDDGRRQRDLLNYEIVATRNALHERENIINQHYQDVDKIQSDWLLGAQEGLSNWLDSSRDVYSTVSQGINTALGNGLDNISSMLEGNKVSWRSWGASVLQILERVALQEAAVSLFGGSGGKGLFGSLVSGISGLFGSQTTANAKGGVYDSPSLSAFSNSVVSKPTRFAFAKGAGLMGEAGPEAIMPLTRAADGSLGVRATGINSPPSQPTSGVQVNINISDTGNAQSQDPADWRQFGNEIGQFVDQRYKQNLRRDLRDDGDIGRAMRGRR